MPSQTSGKDANSTPDDNALPRITILRTSCIPYLTQIAHATTPFINTFLLIHLSAPVMANLGGSSLSSQVMLLGREYYQTPFAETYLVNVPVLLHISSGVLKRLLAPKGLRSKRSWRSILSLSGYGVSLFYFQHYFTHRVAPQLVGLGTSDIDYELVKHGLAVWPWRSAFLYGALVFGIAVHVSEGASILWNTYLQRSLSGLRKKTTRRIAAASLLPIFTGLYWISKEPLMSFASHADKFQQAFVQSWIYGV